MAADSHRAASGAEQDEWMRRSAQAFGDAAAFEALRDHVRDGQSQCVEWCPICRVADLLRASATPELREQLGSVQREALLTVRAVVDHYLSRLDTDPAERGPRVRDIPIE